MASNDFTFNLLKLQTSYSLLVLVSGYLFYRHNNTVYCIPSSTRTVAKMITTVANSRSRPSYVRGHGFGWCYIIATLAVTAEAPGRAALLGLGGVVGT